MRVAKPRVADPGPARGGADPDEDQPANDECRDREVKEEERIGGESHAARLSFPDQLEELLDAHRFQVHECRAFGVAAARLRGREKGEKQQPGKHRSHGFPVTGRGPIAGAAARNHCNGTLRSSAS